MKKNRKRLRLKDYDYAQGGYYFVTVCAKDGRCLFGEVVCDKMELNETGEIVEQCWINIVDYFQNIMIDEYVVMPNHFHGIVGIESISIKGMMNHARTGFMRMINRGHTRGTFLISTKVRCYLILVLTVLYITFRILL